MKSYLLFFVLMILTSCSSENPQSSAQKSLEGKWNWVQSSGGIAGTTTTPASTNQVIYLEFSGNSFKKYINGTFSVDNTFEIKIDKSIFGGEKPMLVSTSPIKYFSPMSFEIKDDKLYLNEECYDCFGSVYVRAK